MEQAIPCFLATTSQDKAREWNRIFDRLGETNLRVHPLERELELIEVQSLDPVEVVVTKAIDAFWQDGRQLLVEDVSFAVSALHGFPGALYKHAHKGIGNKGLLSLLVDKSDRSAIATITIAFVSLNHQSVHVISVNVPGQIPSEALGENGFGFDPIFIPDGKMLTYAQMSAEEKNDCSMRRLAIEELVKGNWNIYPIAGTPLHRHHS